MKKSKSLNNVSLGQGYIELLIEIKDKIKRSQFKATLSVNELCTKVAFGFLGGVSLIG
jgi:hypothetical protein